MSTTMNTARRIWTLVIVSIGLFMMVLDNLVVNVALPSIRVDLGASIQTLEWTVNAYILAYAVLLLTGAALGDRLGRKRMFIAGIAVFTAGSAAAALSPSIGFLIGSRVAQGVGAAIVTPLTLTLLADAVLRQPRLRGDQRRVAGDVLRHVRLDLLPESVPPDRAPQHAASGRGQAAGLDRRRDGGRARGRIPLGALREPPVHGRRARAAGHRAGHAGRAGERRSDLREHGDPVRPGRHRHGAGLRPLRQRGPGLGPDRPDRPGLRCGQRD